KTSVSLSGFNVKALKAHLQSFYPTYLFFCVCLSFVGNTEIEIDIKRYYCKAGIKSIQMHGVLRVVLEPLLGDLPLVGALSAFFLKKPV
ncbi:unnamed protein product, partial [Tetraodon nigroviridis]